MDEEAKAVQEVAKTAATAIKAGEKMGGFIAKYVHGSLEQAMGIFEDKLKYTRWERQVRLMQQAEQVMKNAGYKGVPQAIPLKLAVPLLQGASMEDDDLLQDKWVNLLSNAAIPGSGVDLHRSYIDILEALTPYEARILDTIYSIPFPYTSRHEGIVAYRLPDSALAATPADHTNSLSEPRVEVRLALANLARAGVIKLGSSLGGGEIFGIVHPTLLGLRFVEACKAPAVIQGEAQRQTGPSESELTTRTLDKAHDE